MGLGEMGLGEMGQNLIFSLPVLQHVSCLVKIWLASDSSGIRAINVAEQGETPCLNSGVS